jgi:hypothetical protein
MTNKRTSFTIPVVVLVILASVAHFGVGISTAVAADSGDAWDQFQRCKINCNESFGGVDVLPPAASGGTSLAWSNCILACERKYWKQFDKEMELDK